MVSYISAGGLPYRESADGITGEIKLRDLLHMANAEIVVHRPLIDAPEHLSGIDGVVLRGIARESLLAAASQRTVRPHDASQYSRGAGMPTHSSNAMAISEPRLA